MTDISYPAFIEKNMEPIFSNITYTNAEWMKHISDIQQAQYDAMVIGLIMGFIICAIGILVGTWWKNLGNS